MQTGDEADGKLDETLILDVLAGGGKVGVASLFLFFLIFVAEVEILNWNKNEIHVTCFQNLIQRLRFPLNRVTQK